jgi:LysM repeat protein
MAKTNIERVSRYNDGPLLQLPYEHTNTYAISVYRNWVKSKTVSYKEYTWVSGDTLASLAVKYCGGAKYWWEIMDINPEITDPFYIDPGTIIRVPYGN